MRHLISRAARQLVQKPLEPKSCIWQRVSRALGGSSGSRQYSDQSLEPSESHFNFHLECSNDNRLVSLINSTLSSTQHPLSSSQLQANHNHGVAATILPGAAAGRAEPPPRAGLAASVTHFAGGAVSQVVHEHLHSGRAGPLSGPLPDVVPRPDAQPAAEPRGKPDLDLWQHGTPVRDIALPAAGIEPSQSSEIRSGIDSPRKVGTGFTLGKSLFGKIANFRAGGAFSSDAAKVFQASSNGIVHMNGTRGFRSAVGATTLLADESDKSEVAGEGGDSAEVAVSDQASEAVPEGRRKYGPRRSTRRPPRSIVGSYDEEFEDELDLAERSPWQDEMYNIRPRVDQYMMDELGANAPLDFDELHAEADALGLVSEIPDSYAGLPLVLRWETRFVLAPGPSAHHPLNRKVKLQAYLSDLGLSEKARERMIALVGPRFNRTKDELTIISQRYSHREENRKDVLRILYALLEESKKADTEEEEVVMAA